MSKGKQALQEMYNRCVRKLIIGPVSQGDSFWSPVYSDEMSGLSDRLEECRRSIWTETGDLNKESRWTPEDLYQIAFDFDLSSAMVDFAIETVTKKR